MWQVRASRTVILNRLRRLVVRIAAAHTTTALAVPSAGTHANCSTWLMTLNRACGCIRGRDIVIRGEGVFQSLPGLKITEFPPRIKHPSDPHQMALLANAVAGARFKLCRIHDRTGSGVRKMLFGGAVAPLTSDGLGRKNRRAILVVSAGNVKRRSCVAEDATLGDGTCEVRIPALLLMAGGQIVRIATFIKSDRRLEEMPRDVD